MGKTRLIEAKQPYQGPQYVVGREDRTGLQNTCWSCQLCHLVRRAYTSYAMCLVDILLCEVWWLSEVPLSRDKALHCLPSAAVNGAAGRSVYYWCLCSSPSMPLFCPHQKQMVVGHPYERRMIGVYTQGSFNFLNAPQKDRMDQTTQEDILLKFLQGRQCSLMRSISKKRETTWLS